MSRPGPRRKPSRSPADTALATTPATAPAEREPSVVPAGRPAERQKLLTAFIGAEEYALPLVRVHEVIASEGVTRVPTAAAFILGLVDLHGAAIPVIDLAAKFAAAAPDASASRSILVVQAQIGRQPTLVGIVIDRLGRVQNVAAEQIQPPPAIESLIAVEFLTGVFQTDGRFVLCVDVDRVLGADEAAAVAELSQQSALKPAVHVPVARTPYLCVRVAGEPCALSLKRLHEILPCGTIAHIPGAAPFVLGATNVRGSVVPVIDVARRYGLSATRRDAESCLLLVEVGEGGEDATVGMLVEAVDRLVQVPTQDVDRTPPFGSRFPGAVVSGMAPVAGGFVPILDTDVALADEERNGRAATPEADRAGDAG